MELSDFISDLEQTKILGLSAFGFITGGAASILNFDKIIENSKRKVFCKNKEKVYTKLSISAIGGLTSVNYDGSLLSNSGEALAYTALFRLGYEAGDKLTRSILQYKK